MWTEIILFIFVISGVIYLIDHYFSVSSQIEKLWRRVYKLNDEVYKVFEENPGYNNDELAFENSREDLYDKIWKLNDEINRTGKLIDALLCYYHAENTLHHGYQIKSKVNGVERDKLYIEKPRPYLSVHDALKIREESIQRKEYDDSSAPSTDSKTS